MSKCTHFWSANSGTQECLWCRKQRQAPSELAPATGSEPDWKNIAGKLMRQCEFALAALKADGWTGELMDTSGPTCTTRHWKEYMADTMELIPGVKVDRQAMHACSLPKKQRDKFFRDRAASKEAQNAGTER